MSWLTETVTTKLSVLPDWSRRGTQLSWWIDWQRQSQRSFLSSLTGLDVEPSCPDELIDRDSHLFHLRTVQLDFSGQTPHFFGQLRQKTKTNKQKTAQVWSLLRQETKTSHETTGRQNNQLVEWHFKCLIREVSNSTLLCFITNGCSSFVCLFFFFRYLYSSRIPVRSARFLIF